MKRRTNTCSDCMSEFEVQYIVADEEEVNYCPYCGEKLESDEDSDEEEYDIDY